MDDDVDLIRTDEPSDRLTRLCKVMSDALDADPESEGVQAIVMVTDGDRGGIVVHQYESENEALVDLLVHARALFNANGKELAILPMGNPSMS